MGRSISHHEAAKLTKTGKNLFFNRKNCLLAFSSGSSCLCGECSSASSLPVLGHVGGSVRKGKIMGKGKTCGSALIVALGVLALLAVMGVVFLTVMQQDNRAASALNDSIICDMLTRDALQAVVASAWEPPNFPVTPGSSNNNEVDNDLDGVNDAVWVRDVFQRGEVAGAVLNPRIAVTVRSAEGFLAINAAGGAPGNAASVDEYPYARSGYWTDQLNLARALYWGSRDLQYGIPALYGEGALTADEAIALAGEIVSWRYGPDGGPGTAGMDDDFLGYLQPNTDRIDNNGNNTAAINRVTGVPFDENATVGPDGLTDDGYDRRTDDGYDGVDEGDPYSMPSFSEGVDDGMEYNPLNTIGDDTAYGDDDLADILVNTTSVSNIEQRFIDALTGMPVPRSEAQAKNAFDALRHFLTTTSIDTILNTEGAPRIPLNQWPCFADLAATASAGTVAQIDAAKRQFWATYKPTIMKIFRAGDSTSSEAQIERKALQLICNIVDAFDNDNLITDYPDDPLNPGARIYGVDRHPYINEIFVLNLSCDGIDNNNSSADPNWANNGTPLDPTDDNDWRPWAATLPTPGVTNVTIYNWDGDENDSNEDGDYTYDPCGLIDGYSQYLGMSTHKGCPTGWDPDDTAHWDDPEESDYFYVELHNPYKGALINITGWKLRIEHALSGATTTINLQPAGVGAATLQSYGYFVIGSDRTPADYADFQNLWFQKGDRIDLITSQFDTLDYGNQLVVVDSAFVPNNVHFNNRIGAFEYDESGTVKLGRQFESLERIHPRRNMWLRARDIEPGVGPRINNPELQTLGFPLGDPLAPAALSIRGNTASYGGPGGPIHMQLYKNGFPNPDGMNDDTLPFIGMPNVQNRNGHHRDTGTPAWGDRYSWWRFGLFIPNESWYFTTVADLGKFLVRGYVAIPDGTGIAGLPSLGTVPYANTDYYETYNLYNADEPAIVDLDDMKFDVFDTRNAYIFEYFTVTNPLKDGKDNNGNWNVLTDDLDGNGLPSHDWDGEGIAGVYEPAFDANNDKDDTYDPEPHVDEAEEINVVGRIDINKSPWQVLTALPLSSCKYDQPIVGHPYWEFQEGSQFTLVSAGPPFTSGASLAGDINIRAYGPDGNPYTGDETPFMSIAEVIGLPYVQDTLNPDGTNATTVTGFPYTEPDTPGNPPVPHKPNKAERDRILGSFMNLITVNAKSAGADTSAESDLFIVYITCQLTDGKDRNGKFDGELPASLVAALNADGIDNNFDGIIDGATDGIDNDGDGSTDEPDESDAFDCSLEVQKVHAERRAMAVVRRNATPADPATPQSQIVFFSWLSER